MSSTRALTRSLAHFFSGTMLSRLLGMVRDMVMGAAFGSAPIIAAFFIAFRFANLPRRLLGEGAMHAAFIPQFETLRKTDPIKAHHFFRDLSYTLALVTTLFSLLTALILFLTFGKSSSVVRFTCLFFPFLPFICLYGLTLAYHNCSGSYFRPSSASCLFNVAWIGGALILWGKLSEFSISLLALTVGLGFILQWAAVALPIRHLLSPKNLSLWSPEIKKCCQFLGPAILGVGATQINSALDPLFAYAANASAPAYLWWAIRLQQLPLALFGVALSTVILPPLSRASNADEYRSVLSWGKRRAFDLMAPCTLGIFVCGLPAVTLIYFRGHFTAHDVAETTTCLMAYGLGLVPMALVFLRTAIFHSRGDYKTPALASGLSVLINLSLNSLFIFALHWPAPAVALATSLSALFQSSFLKARLKETGGALYPWFASLIAALATLLTDHLLFSSTLWNRPLPTHALQQLLTLSTLAAAFLITYALLMLPHLLKARPIGKVE